MESNNLRDCANHRYRVFVSANNSFIACRAKIKQNSDFASFQL
jgi:hypothetical protein